MGPGLYLPHHHQQKHLTEQNCHITQILPVVLWHETYSLKRENGVLFFFIFWKWCFKHLKMNFINTKLFVENISTLLSVHSFYYILS